MEPDRALEGSAAGRPDCRLSTGDWPGWKATALRIYGDAQRRLLCRLRYARLLASTDALSDGNGRPSPDPISWRPFAAALAEQIWLQTDQANWAHRLYQPTTGRLLDQARLRLVRGIVTGSYRVQRAGS